MGHVTRAHASRREHVTAAERLANEVRKAGVEYLVHISGIGADEQSPSRYIRARGRGEQAVRGIFGRATVIRPAVMFGLDDTFLNTLIKLLPSHLSDVRAG